MKEFIFSILTSMFQIDMSNPHETPFAMPLMIACLFGGLIGFTIVKFIGNEHKRDQNIYRQED